MTLTSVSVQFSQNVIRQQSANSHWRNGKFSLAENDVGRA